jgi:phosphate/sulfate permease
VCVRVCGCVGVGVGVGVHARVHLFDPVSQVLVGAIAGVGMFEVGSQSPSINGELLKKILWSWFFTMPLSAASSVLMFWLVPK